MLDNFHQNADHHGYHQHDGDHNPNADRSPTKGWSMMLCKPPLCAGCSGWAISIAWTPFRFFSATILTSTELPSYCKKCKALIIWMNYLNCLDTTKTILTFPERNDNLVCKVQGFKNKWMSYINCLDTISIFFQPPFSHLQSPEWTYCIKCAVKPQKAVNGNIWKLRILHQLIM